MKSLVKSAEQSAGKPAGSNALHNLLLVCDGVYSGGQPDSEAAFAELEKLGVKTIVSVDGAKPDVEAAKKHGIHYVHIPVGYDGLPASAEQSILRVMKERPGPVFFHCHHGKHRGPAAAAIAAMCINKMNAAEAKEYLVKAGTGKEYKGLWRDVEGFKLPPPETKLPELVEVAEVPSLAATMSDVDRIYDRLKVCDEKDWLNPAGQLPIDPAQGALFLKEAFREAARHLEGERKTQLSPGLTEAEHLAESLETACNAQQRRGASAAFTKLTAACKQCHEQHRN